MATDAVVLKEKGNASFKEHRFKDATDFFRKAEAANATDPVYPSNLSAALYELGDYHETVEAVSRSWHVIPPSSNSSLPPKLSSRMVKALSHGIRSGTITSDATEKYRVAIIALESIATNGASPEVSRLWKEWRKIEAEKGNRKQTANEARARLSRIPIFRKPINSILEYYTFGQDGIMSLMDDWGPKDDFPVKVKELSASELGEISFLFGGVGDARHVYATLIGSHRAFSSLPHPMRPKLKVHSTLLDIHPVALARDLCILMLLNKLCEMTGQLTAEATEVKATLFYVYVGVVMPSYCHDRLQNTIKDLQARLSSTPLRMPSWLYINRDLIPGVQDALDYWSTTVPRERTTTEMLNSHTYKLPSRSPIAFLQNTNVSPEYRAQIENSIKQQRDQIGNMLDTLDSARLAQLGIVRPTDSSEKAAKVFRETREEVIDMMFKAHMDGTVGGQMSGEQTFYEKFKVFMPPPEFWHRHPRFEWCVMNGDEALPAKIKKQIDEHVRETWKLNPTLLNRATMQIPSWSSGVRYPDLNLDIFQLPKAIHEFLDRFGLGTPKVAGNGPPSPSYTHVTAFFGHVVEALKAMKDQVKLELLCGELTQELSKMRFGGHEDRPETFPTEYTRAYLSNVPDYTHGILNTIVYALPNIKTGKVSAVAANSLLNSGIWANANEFYHTYTLLTPSDIPRYLGCQCIRNDPIADLAILGNNPLPRPLSSLASRPELTTWLTRILLNTLLPGTGGFGAFRARLPNNLTAFFALLVHLKSVGYPGHWLGEFLSSVIEDKLVTDISPYLGKWPIPISEMNRRVARRKVRLDPWRLELESILSISLEGIPFFITPPEDFTDRSDITTFESPFRPSFTRTGPLLDNPLQFEPVVCLLFLKSIQGTNAAALVKSLPSILDGQEHPTPGNIFILTSQERVDYAAKKIQWKMSRTRVMKMRQEGWAMVGYRTDAQETFTQPVSPLEWRDIGPLPALEIEDLD